MKNKMFVVPGSFVPFNDTVTLLTYKRLKNLDLDMDVFCFKGKEDKSLLAELEKDPDFNKFKIKYTSDLDWAVPRNYPYRLPIGLFLMNKYVHDALKEFEKGEYEYLFSSIVPGISHIAAAKIKRKHPEVKWIASVDAEIPLHISRFFPQFKYTSKPPTDISLMYKMKAIAEEKLKYVYLGNV